MEKPATRAAGLAAGLAWLLAVLAAVLCVSGGRAGCRAATLLGYEGLYFLLGVALYVLLDGRLGGVGVLSAAMAASATVMLKQLLGLPRPPAAAALGATGPGFPSGHTAVATSFWLAMGLLSRSPTLTAGALALAGTVGYTRVALGAHYVGDVVGGFVVGALAALAAAGLTRSEGLFAASVAASPPAMLAALLAAALAPGYRAAWRLAGIDAGLYLAALAGLRLGWEGCLAGRLGGRGYLFSLAAPLASLAAAVGLEKLAGPAGGVAGFAMFAATALASRPLGCRLGAGSRGGWRGASGATRSREPP